MTNNRWEPPALKECDRYEIGLQNMDSASVLKLDQVISQLCSSFNTQYCIFLH